MDSPPPKVEWYLARDGKQYGPLSDAELSRFVELGHLKADDLLWREGLSDWQPATIAFPEQEEVPNTSHTDLVDSSITIAEPLVAARPVDREATSRKALVLALFLIVVLGGAASYAYFRSDWPSSVPSPTSPEERDATNIKLGRGSIESSKT
jgi:GYF domain 2